VDARRAEYEARGLARSTALPVQAVRANSWRLQGFRNSTELFRAKLLLFVPANTVVNPVSRLGAVSLRRQVWNPAA
jgi:hypothetical protein